MWLIIPGGGYSKSYAEEWLLNRLIKRGVKIVAAAGNNSRNLDNNCNFYPACYNDSIIAVGNGYNNENRAKSANFGKVIKAWEDGENRCAGGYCMSGSSQATAIKSGKILAELSKITRRACSSAYDDAFKTTAQQIYKSEKIDKMVNNKLESIKDKVPKEYQKFIESISPVINVLVNGKVEIKREF